MAGSFVTEMVPCEVCPPCEHSVARRKRVRRPKSAASIAHRIANQLTSFRKNQGDEAFAEAVRLITDRLAASTKAAA